MTNDARAKITLPDGRQVWRDGRGRYRDAQTGKWVAREEIEPTLPNILPTTAQKKTSGGLQSAAERQIIEAVRGMGREADTLEDALGQLVGVQAEIALDKDNGAKATNATRLIGQITGILGKGGKQAEDAEADDQPWFVLGREHAKHLLALIEEEQARRETDA